MYNIIGINGLYSDGESSTLKILNHFKNDYNIINFKYPVLGISNFLKNDKVEPIIDRLHNMINYDSENIFICHSYGCYIYLKYYKKYYQFIKNNKVFFIAPSISSNENIKNLIVFYNENDYILRSVTYILKPFYSFVDCSMGYSGSTKSISINCTNILKYNIIDFSFNHSLYFKNKENISFLVNEICKFIK